MKVRTMPVKFAVALQVLVWAALCTSSDDALAISPLLRIEMRSAVQVQSSSIALGDLAFVSSPHLPLLQRAMALPLGRPPLTSESVVIDSVRLESWVHRRLGLRAEDIEWAGSSSSVLTIASQSVPADQVAGVARAALQKHLSQIASQKGFSSARVDLQPVVDFNDIVLPAGKPEIIVRSLETSRPSKRMSVWVDMLADGAFVRALPVRFEVSVFAKAPVASTFMAAGAAMAGEAIQWQEVELMELQFPTAPRLGLEPLRLRRAASAGEVITEKHVQTVHAVNRGELVRLVSQSGLVSLESKVQSLQDGRVGDLIRARPVNASGAVIARVVAPGQLELQQ